MATSAGTPENPLRVAIVGSGPSGFYAAGHLLNAKERTVEVDMFDSLPTPFGLVRAGVAPDHPKIKSVIRVYEKTAAKEGFRYFGNVTVGEDISHAELKERYHAVIYAVGAQTDRSMGIPGEDLPGSWAATEFVAWYNGHPDFRDLEFDLSCKRAAVIGNGNVAMDVARMLVLPREELEVTDTADHAIEVMADSGIEEVVIIGRRGPAQAAFTNPELRELGELTDADVIVDPEDVKLDSHSARSIEGEGDLTARRNVEILTGYSQLEPSGKRRSRWCCASCVRRSRSRATGRSRRSSWCATSWSTAATAACVPSRPMTTRPSTSASCSARSATAGCRSRGCRSTSGRASSPTRRGG